MKTLDLYNEASVLYESHHCLCCGDSRETKNYNFMCGRCIALWMDYKNNPFNSFVRCLDREAQKYYTTDLRVAFLVGGDMYWEINS